jgi:hypothetical protein
MPKANPVSTTLSRRALMSVSVGLVTANVAAAAIAVRAAQAMAPVVPIDATADAELVDMCRECRKYNRVFDQLLNRAGPLEDTDEEQYDLLQSIAYRILNHRIKPLAQQIADIKASSWSGVAAKAGVLINDAGFGYSGNPHDFPYALEPVLASLICDAARLGGYAALPALVKIRTVEV